MGLNDFIINGRVGTFDKLTAKQTLNVGNQSIISQSVPVRFPVGGQVPPALP